jgi:glycosyltransferase involved in cell wall biosynthesis
MRVCHIVPSLEERHGGPSKSVLALAAAQRGHGLAARVCATAPDAPPPPEGDVMVFKRDRPRSLCRSAGLAAHLGQAEAGILQHHSLWLLTLRYAAEASRRAAIPLVISPRGMLSPWALSHHGWRKKLAERLVHPGAFAAARGWHATSPEEADDIRRLGWRQPVCVAPNGVDLPVDADLRAARHHWHDACPALRARPVAVFYSRFHRKKRLRELLDLWLSAPRGDWLLLLAGLPEEYSLAEVQGWIAAAQAQDRVVAVDSTGHPPPYAAAQLFLLPSHSENFGLVVAEALAAGIPALVTDGTPWRGLASHHAGWCVLWEGYSAALATALATPSAELAAMGAAGRAWMSTDFSWAEAARLTADFYRSLTNAAG